MTPNRKHHQSSLRRRVFLHDSPRVELRLPRTLAGVMLVVFLAMASYEWLGHWLDRYLTLWQSACITVPTAVLGAGLATHAGLRRYDRVHQDLLREVVERGSAQEGLSASEARYRCLFENMAEGFAYCRMIFEDGRPTDFEYLSVNAAFEALTGLRNVSGKRVSEVIPGIQEANPDLFEIYGRVVQSGRPERFETFVQALDMWFSISVYCQEPGCFAAVFDVITQRKKTERALRDSEEQYRSLYSSMSEGVALHELVYDEAGTAVDYRILDVNPAYERNSGLSRDRVVGRLASEAYGSGAPPFLDTYARVAETGEPASFDEAYLPLQKTFHVSAFSPSRGRFATVFLDITERERLQSELLQAQKMESLGRLAGGIAHDFNNLLTVVIGYAELTEMATAESDAPHAYAGSIRSAAAHAAELTQQLLAFSRRQATPTTDADLNEVISSTLTMLDRLIREDVKIVATTARRPVVVKADRVHLQQVLLNLVTNARDAMPDGGTIAIEAVTEVVGPADAATGGLAPGEYGVLRVADTGVGMSAEVKGRAFEPFFTTKDPGRGTGLGLATCYGIVEQAGGCILISSPLAIGTTMSVYLPLSQSHSEPAQDRGDSALDPAGSETIMVVEDEESVRDLAVAVLRSHGYVTLSARDGEQALEVLRSHAGRIDLVVTDLIMPNMSGLDLARRIVKRRPDTTVMFVSGYSGYTNDGPGLNGYPGAFLSKPFTPSDLATAVRRVLDRASSGVEPGSGMTRAPRTSRPA